ncbi:MAG: helix-turn-helix transcriptional regulator [Acidobacteriaceae bacterium]
MSSLPESGFVREKQLLRNPKTGDSGILPFSHATLWAKIKSGRFPRPVKLGPKITAWRVEDVRRWIEEVVKAAA